MNDNPKNMNENSKSDFNWDKFDIDDFLKKSEGLDKLLLRLK